MKKRLLTAFLVMLVAAAACGCSRMTEMEEAEAQYETSPDEGNIKKAENFVKSFVKAISANDYSNILSYIYVPDGAFVTADDMKWYMPRSAVGDICGSGLTVDEILVDGSAVEKNVAFSVGGNIYKVKLRLGNDNTWKIDMSAAYVENWTLKVPAGCKTAMDSIDISRYSVETNGIGDYSIYNFPAIVAKTHDVIVTSELYGAFLQEITPQKSSDTYTIVCSIGDAETSNMLKAVQAIWNNIYTAYKGGATVPDIKDYFVSGYDLNKLTTLLTESLPTMENTFKNNKGISYQNFYMSDIQPYVTNNYGAAVLAANNAVLLRFKYKVEFTDSNGNYHNVNRISDIVLAYENRKYRIKEITNNHLFTDNDYTKNDF